MLYRWCCSVDGAAVVGVALVVLRPLPGCDLPHRVRSRHSSGRSCPVGGSVAAG